MVHVSGALKPIFYFLQHFQVSGV